MNDHVTGSDESDDAHVDQGGQLDPTNQPDPPRQPEPPDPPDRDIPRRKAPPVTFGAQLAGCGFLLITVLGLLIVWAGDSVTGDGGGTPTPTETATATATPTTPTSVDP